MKDSRNLESVFFNYEIPCLVDLNDELSFQGLNCQDGSSDTAACGNGTAAGTGCAVGTGVV